MSTENRSIDRKAAIYAARESLGSVGAMLSNSKSGYAISHANNLFVFNANVCTREHGTLWSGDLDVTVSAETLKALSAVLHTDLFILAEHDARPLDTAYFLFNEQDTPSRIDADCFSPEKALVIVSAQGIRTNTHR